MKTILVIEPDNEHRQPIKEAIAELSGEFEIIFYDDLKDFFTGIRNIIKPSADESSERPIEVPLLIGDSDSFDKINTSLLIKTQKMFIQEKLCDEENPIRFMVSAFDHSDFDSSKYYDPIISNVICKPYDKLLIKELIQFALEGRKAITSSLYSHKTSSNVELIKDVKISFITELGFRTVSNQPIQVGKVSRYYSELFESENLDYVFAFCYRCRANDTNPVTYNCSFSFFGIAPEQLGAIRRSIHKAKDHSSLTLETENETGLVHTILIVNKDPEVYDKIHSIASEYFENIKIHYVSSIHQLNQYLPPDEQKNIDTEAGGPLLPKADNFKIIFNKTAETILSAYSVVDDKEKELDDLFTVPLVAVRKLKGYFKSFLNEGDYDSLLKYLVKNKAMPSATIEVKDDSGVSTHINIGKSGKKRHADHGEVIELTFRELSKGEVYKLVQSQGLSFENLDAVFVDNYFFEEDRYKILNDTVKKLMGATDDVTASKGEEAATAQPSVKYFGVHRDPILSYEMLEKLSYLDDYFCLPLDNFYLNRKLKQIFPHWIVKDIHGLAREGYDIDAIIKAAMPVQIEAVSESLLTLLYSRELAVGEIRRFILNRPGVKNNPEIAAMCNFSEPAEGGVFRSYFVLFGIRDHDLKHIRQWVKDEYIKTKQSQ